MSSADKQLLINIIHQQLDQAISYNLYPGLAYGAPPPYLWLPFSLYIRTPEHPSRPPFRDIAGRALRLNQDPSVRTRAICFRLTRHPRGHSSFAFFTLPQFQGDLV